MSEVDEKEKLVAAYCSHCKGYKALIVKGICYSVPMMKNQYLDDYYEVSVLGLCSSCKQPILAQNWGEVGAEEHSGLEYLTVFPREGSREIHFDIIKQISTPYHEAVKCERSGTWNACVVMVGRALEAVAKDYDSKIKTISTGMKKMHEAGVISDELFEWANELRILRNIGAHASDRNVEEVDAHESLDFLQAILETIYHLRPMFRKMKERRGV